MLDFAWSLLDLDTVGNFELLDLAITVDVYYDLLFGLRIFEARLCLCSKDIKLVTKSLVLVGRHYSKSYDYLYPQWLNPARNCDPTCNIPNVKSFLPGWICLKGMFNTQV